MVADYLQLPLLRADGPAVIRAQPHYIPILLDRSGERDALANVDPGSWPRMTPLI